MAAAAEVPPDNAKPKLSADPSAEQDPFKAAANFWPKAKTVLKALTSNNSAETGEQMQREREVMVNHATLLKTFSTITEIYDHSFMWVW